MVESIVYNHCPSDWSLYNFNEYTEHDVLPNSLTYRTLQSSVAGHFNLGVTRIVKVENPYLYGQFILKKEEYETRGHCMIQTLYHDTAASKVDSILRTNLNWRCANRVKYGMGVSFSPSPSYANQESSRSNGTDRAMIVADVLVGNIQTVTSTVTIPKDGCDTTMSNNGQVYVKYYDDEFYPKYVIYYVSRVRQYYRRFRF